MRVALHLRGLHSYGRVNKFADPARSLAPRLTLITTRVLSVLRRSSALTRLAVALDARGHPGDDGLTRSGGKTPAGALGRRRRLLVPPEEHLRSRTHAPLFIMAQRNPAATCLASTLHGCTPCPRKA